MKSSIHELVVGFSMMAAHLNPGQEAASADALAEQMQSLLWYVRVAAIHAPGGVRFTVFADGFGLLVLKPPAFDGAVPTEGPQPIGLREQAQLKQHMERVLNAILPDDGAGLYQHFETDDGLICALFRLEDESRISIAAFGGQDVRHPALRSDEGCGNHPLNPPTPQTPSR